VYVSDWYCRVLCVGSSYGDCRVGCGFSCVVQCSNVCGVDSNVSEGVQLSSVSSRFSCSSWFSIGVVVCSVLGMLYVWRVHRVGVVVCVLGSDLA